jgi:hypothetical protein
MFGADQLGLRFTPSLWRTVAPPRILAEAHYGIYIDRDQLLAEARRFGKNDYGRYLANLLE